MVLALDMPPSSHVIPRNSKPIPAKVIDKVCFIFDRSKKSRDFGLSVSADMVMVMVLALVQSMRGLSIEYIPLG